MLMTSSDLGKNDDTTNFATKQRQIEKGAWWGEEGWGEEKLRMQENV